MLLGAAKRKKDEPVEKEVVHRVPVRINGSVLAEMAKFHSPKEKSQWICEAIDDLLGRETYLDANWQDAGDDDTASFLAMVNLDEGLVDPASIIVLVPDSTYTALMDAVKVITWLNIGNSRSVRPALIRSAIRQRIILNGRLLNDFF